MFRLFAYAAVCSLGLCSTPMATAHPHLALSPYRAIPARATYHRQVQILDAQIRLQIAEIESIERVLVEWQPLDRFRDSRVLGLDIERMQLALARAKLSLECLRQQKFDLVQSRGRGW